MCVVGVSGVLILHSQTKYWSMTVLEVKQLVMHLRLFDKLCSKE